MNETKRHATFAELGPYVDMHREMIVSRTAGLSDIQVLEDEDGGYALFVVKEVPEDPRELTIEASAGMMVFTTLETGERVSAKVRVKIMKEEN